MSEKETLPTNPEQQGKQRVLARGVGELALMDATAEADPDPEQVAAEREYLVKQPGLETTDPDVFALGWLGYDQIQVADPLSHEPPHFTPSPFSPGQENLLIQRGKQAGMFGMNNGLLAVVDKHGAMHVGDASKERIAALEKGGYRHGDIAVPFSGTEAPTDLAAKQRLAHLRNRAAS